MTNTVDLFEQAPLRGVSFDQLAARVQSLAAVEAPRPGHEVRDARGIRDWLAARPGGVLTICYGHSMFRPAAEQLARWLETAWGIKAAITAEDGRFEIQGRENFQVAFLPTQADVLIGNAWANNMIAMLDSTWPYNNPQAPAILSGRLTATLAWPGADRGIVALTRAKEFRRADHSTWGLGYGNTDGYAVRDVDDATQPWLRRRLLLLASSPMGAIEAVNALEKAVRQAK